MSKLNQFNDIEGSLNHNSSMILANELLQLGTLIAGQTGTSASLGGLAPTVTVSGLTGMSDGSICKKLSISGANNPVNNGNFNIIQYIDPTRVVIFNSSFIGPELNNGHLTWAEYNQYSAEDDNNYHRTDRANIKGVPYYSSIPQYTTCNNQNTPIDANLINIAGHTTDAKALIDNIKYTNLTVNSGDTYLTLTSIGNLKHADIVDITGIPVNGNDYATFVCILRDGYATKLNVLSGSYLGWVVYGKTRIGASISPDSIEIEFMMMPQNGDFSQALPYTWEGSQYTDIEVIIGYRISLENLSEVALRKILIDLNYVNTSINVPTLEQVLIASNDANFLNIINVNNLLSTNIYSDDGYITNNLTVGNSITAVDGYFTHLYLPDNFLVASDLDGYIKLDSVTVENLTTTENDTGKLLAPDGSGGVAWITPPSLDGYLSYSALDGYITEAALDGYIKVDAVNTNNLSTTENNTGKLLAPDGIGGVIWIVPPSLDGYLIISDLDPYAKITDLDGYLTIVDLDGYIKVDAITTDNLSTTENDTGKLLAPNGSGGVVWIVPPSLDGYLTITDLDGYIKIDAVNTDNLSTTENNTGKLLAPNGIGGVIWITPPSLDGYLTVSDLDPYAKITDLDGYLTITDLDGYITSAALDGYIKVDAITTDNLSTTENDTGKLLAPDGSGGVTWIIPPNLDGYLTIIDLDGYITSSALDGYIKVDAVTTDNLSTTENNTNKLLAPDGTGGVIWITPTSLDGYLTIEDLDGYIKVDAVTTDNLSTTENNTNKLLAPDGTGGVIWITPTSLDGYLTIEDLDGYIKLDSVTTDNLSTTENNTNKLLAPDGTGGVIWITPTSLDGYLTIEDLDGYIKLDSVTTDNLSTTENNTNKLLAPDGTGGVIWITPTSLDGYLTIEDLDGYIKVDAVTTDNLSTSEYNEFLVLRPNGVGGVKWSNDGYIITPDTVTDNAIVLWQGTDGYTIQNSNVIINNTNDISGINTISSSNLTTTANDATFNFGSNDVVIGDGYIKTTTSLQTYIGNISRTTLTNNSLFPTINNGSDLGTILNYWEDGYISNIRSLDGYFENTLTVNGIDIQNTYSLLQDPSGFPNRIDSTISVDDDGYIFTISPTVSSFDFYVKGIKYTKNSAQTVEWTDVEGIHFFYFDNAGELTHTLSEDEWILALKGNGAIVAAIYWNITNSQTIYLADERHGFMDPQTHAYLHLAFGAQWISGGQLTNIISDGDGSLNSHTRFGLTTTQIADEDNLFIYTNGFPQEFDPIAYVPIYYQLGTSQTWRMKEADTFPLIQSGVAGYTNVDGLPAYNYTNGSTWSLAPVTNGNYFLMHYYVGNDIIQPVFGVLGQTVYTTIGLAQTGALTEINNLGVVLRSLSKEFTPLGTVIYQVSKTYSNTVKCRIIKTEEGLDYIDFRGNVLSGGGASSGGITDHGNLTGLADDDHPQYLLADGIRNMTGDLNLGTHAITGVTTINSSYLVTTANDATFNFGSNDIVIGDGYIKASGSTLQTYIGNTSELTLNATEFCPTTDSHTSLGITEKRWSNCFTDAATIETLTSCTTASITTANITTGVFATVAKPDTNNGADLGETGTRWNNIYGTTLNLNGAVSGVTTFNSTYLITTAKEATFNFGSNDVVIGDGYIKASGSSLQTYIGNTSELTLTNDTFRPTTDGGLNLGDDNYYFESLHAQMGVFSLVINPITDGNADIGLSDCRWNNIFCYSLDCSNYLYVNGSIDLNGTLEGATTISSSNFTTTANDATFNFGSNDIVIGDGYIKASGSTLQTYIGNTSKLILDDSRLYPTINGGIDLGISSNRFFYIYSNYLDTNNLSLNGTISGATTIGSSYFTTTANDATFNFGSNDIVIGDGFIKASGSTLQTYIGSSPELTLNATQFYPTTNSHTSLGITGNRWSNCFTDAATITTLTSCTTASITTANITTGVFATVAKPDTNNGADLGETGTRWSNIYGTTLNLNGTISGATTIGSTYFTTTANDATFNFGSNDIVIGDGYIKASGASLQTYIGNTSELTLNATQFYPTSNSHTSLGTTDYRWSTIYGTALNLNGTISGATTIDSSYFTTTANDATFNFGSNDVVIGDGYIKASGSTLQTYIGKTSKLILTSNYLYPTTNGSFSLGTTSERFNTIYAYDINCTDDVTAFSLILNGPIFGATSINLNGKISGATIIGSTYFTTTANDATLNFGSNDVVIGDGYIKASGSTLQTYIGSSSKLTLANDTLRPSTNGTLTLGDGSYGFLGAHFYNPAGCSITLKAATDKNSYINFGDTDQYDIGRILYSHTNNYFKIRLDNSDYYTMSKTAFYPPTAGLNLGVDSTNRWNTIYCKAHMVDNRDLFSDAKLYILTDDGYSSILYFGDKSNVAIGAINYNHASNVLSFKVNNAFELGLSSTTLYPLTNNGLTLGNSSYRWNTVYGTSLDLNGTISGATTIGSSYFTTTAKEATFNFGSNDVVIGDGYIKSSGSMLQFYIENTSELRLNATAFYPTTDSNTMLGRINNRWSEVFATNGTINTSDERQKQDILPIDDDVLTAWGDVSLVFFRWIDAVNEKGDDARIHSGFISQKIKEVFAAHKLDAQRYGLFCYDSWEEQVDNEGNVIQSAGDSYGIRITECLAVEAAYQRRRADKIEEQNKQLSARISQIEQFLNLQE